MHCLWLKNRVEIESLFRKNLTNNNGISRWAAMPLKQMTCMKNPGR